jgi:hypothetical protein
MSNVEPDAFVKGAGIPHDGGFDEHLVGFEDRAEGGVFERDHRPGCHGTAPALLLLVLLLR